MKKTFVSILVGSESDLPTMQSAMSTLDQLGVTWEAKIASAHRTPDITRNYVREAEERGCAVFIAAAGLAAHLAGAVAAQTTRPVIGVPMDGGPLSGRDALLSTVQMPGGVPVACVAIGRAGATNAAHLAAQILALADEKISARVRDTREKNMEKVVAADRALQKSLSG